MKRSASLFVVLALVWRSEAHSWLACVDYDSSTGICRGYARNWFSVMRGFSFSTDRGRDNRPGRNFPEGLVCDARKEARTNPVTAAYDETYPMAVLQVGQTVRWRWPAKNHATVGVQRGVQVFITTDANLNTDDFIPEPIAQMDFSNCDPRRPNVDNADCQDTWVVPSNTKPGIHTLMWWWEFNAGEFYNSCADVYVVAAGAPFPTAAPVPPTLQPTPRPTPSGGETVGCCSWSACARCEPTGPFCLQSSTNCENNCGGMWCPGAPVAAPTPAAPTPAAPTAEPSPAPTPVAPTPVAPTPVAPTMTQPTIASPTPPPATPTAQPVPGSACCSWTQCQRCEPTGRFCLASQNNCESFCGGMWCTDPGSPVPRPTPRPTNPPTNPTVQPTAPPVASQGCCSWTGCDVCQPTSEWCLRGSGNCEGPCNGQWCPSGGQKFTSVISGQNSGKSVDEDFIQVTCPPIAIPPSGSFKVDVIVTTALTNRRTIGIDVVKEGENQPSSGRGFLTIEPTNDAPVAYTVDIQISTTIPRPQMEGESSHLLIAWVVDETVWSQGLEMPWMNATALEYTPVIIEDNVRQSAACARSGSDSGDSGTSGSSTTVIAVSVVLTLVVVGVAAGILLWCGGLDKCRGLMRADSKAMKIGLESKSDFRSTNF
ncbi:hypothetical protein AAMO2058_001265900 [Amorphochlora amoebiformis]